MSGMNWRRVHWENRFVQAAKEGYLQDEDPVGRRTDVDAPLRRRSTVTTSSRSSRGAVHKHTISITTLGSKRWVGRCSCGWTHGPRKQSAVKAAAIQHEANTKMMTLNSPTRKAPPAEEQAKGGWFPTDVACHICDTYMSVLGAPSGKAVATRCSHCDVQWVMQRYDDTTRTWLQAALDSVLCPQPEPKSQAAASRKASAGGQTRKLQAGRPAGPAPRSKAKACKHRIVEGQCPICNGRGSVYITGGGTRFHKTSACPSLVKGQEKVLERGGDPMPVEGVVVRSIKLLSRDACRTCFPVV